MYKTSLIVFQIFLATFSAANAFAGGTVFLDTQGKDPRQDMTSTVMPWSSIGRLTTISLSGGMEYLCTGTLIDKNIVITAAHCVIEQNDDPNKNVLLNKISYQPNLKSGTSDDTSAVIQVIVGTLDPLHNGGNDWAILVLADDLGSKYGTMDVTATSDLVLPMTVQFAGYSADFNDGNTAGFVNGCQIVDTAFEGPRTKLVRVFNHGCSAMEGSSGGALFHLVNDRYTIVAINTEGGVDKDGNAAISVREFSDQLANTGVMTNALIRAVQAAKLKFQK